MKANFAYKPAREQIYPQQEFIIERVVRLCPADFAKRKRRKR